MKKLLLVCFPLLLAACQDKPSSPKVQDAAPTSALRLPAQWEKQEAVWLMFPPMNHVQDLENQAVIRQLAETLAPQVKVRVLVANDSLEKIALKVLPEPWLKQGRIELVKLPYEEIWTRDVCAVFLLKDGKLAATDFNFDAWSYADSSEVELDESLDERIAARLGIPSISSQLIHEGGNLESNGKGTLIVCGAVELQRNPHKTRPEIDAEIKRLTGAQQIIWLQQGVNEDDSTFDSPIEVPDGQRAYTLLTTGGHTDEFVRFVNDSTVLLAEPAPEDLATDPIARENKKRMDENLAILQATRLPDGRPLKVLRITTPLTLSRMIEPNDWVYGAISGIRTRPGQIFPKGNPVRAG